MAKFKVGDTVRIKDTKHVRSWGPFSMGSPIGQIRKLTEEDCLETYESGILVNDNEFWIDFKEDDLELIKPAAQSIPKSVTLEDFRDVLAGRFVPMKSQEFIDEVCENPWEVGMKGWLGNYGGFELYQQPKPKTKTIMTSIKEFAKNLTLLAEEKALRKAGLKTECGDYTEAATEIIMQKLCAEREAELVEIATKKIEEDKK